MIRKTKWSHQATQAAMITLKRNHWKSRKSRKPAIRFHQRAITSQGLQEIPTPVGNGYTWPKSLYGPEYVFPYDSGHPSNFWNYYYQSIRLSWNNLYDHSSERLFGDHDTICKPGESSSRNHMYVRFMVCRVYDSPGASNHAPWLNSQVYSTSGPEGCTLEHILKTCRIVNYCTRAYQKQFIPPRRLWTFILNNVYV